MSMGKCPYGLDLLSSPPGMVISGCKWQRLEQSECTGKCSDRLLKRECLLSVSFRQIAVYKDTGRNVLGGISILCL